MPVLRNFSKKLDRGRQILIVEDSAEETTECLEIFLLSVRQDGGLEQSDIRERRFSEIEMKTVDNAQAPDFH